MLDADSTWEAWGENDLLVSSVYSQITQLETHDHGKGTTKF